VEDRQIIKLLKKSPDDGLSAVLTQYGGLLKAIAVRILGPDCQSDAEECVADTLVSFWKAFSSFDGEKSGSLKAYLCRVARNTAINRKRKLSRCLDITLEWELEDGLDMEDTVLGSLDRQAVTEAVDSLPEPDRTIFIRRYYCGQPVKAIACEMGLSVKTVENSLHRKKSRLRSKLMERGILL